MGLLLDQLISLLWRELLRCPVDVRDKVWDWLQNPRVVKREGWMRLRGPIMLVIFEIAKIIWEYGLPSAA